MTKWTWIYIIFINIAAVMVCLYDKRAAIKNHRRIPENTLLMVGLVGGGVGLLAGMILFRHKIRKWKFLIGVPLIIVLNLYVYTRIFGSWPTV